MYNRETELLIGVTMYNVGNTAAVCLDEYLQSPQEDEVLLTRTLHGVLSEDRLF